MSDRIAAIVAVHGVRVGQLDRFGDDEEHVFSFDPGWLSDPKRPTLGQLFEDRRPEPIPTSGLPCWFAHLLPQGPWARHLKRWAQLPEEASELELLVSTGRDLPGAVSLEPATPRLFGAGGYAKRAPPNHRALAFSLAGAQWKLSVRPGERGLVVPVSGQTGAFIAKFDGPLYPGLPRVEHATTEWARRSGIGVHETRLADVSEFDGLPNDLPTGDGTVFLASRFDRSETGPVHFEDFGQILDRPPGPSQYWANFEDLGRVTGALVPQDREEWLRRLVFVVLSGNGDAHLKNWGVLYPDRIHPTLSPAYDQVATVALRSLQHDDLALGIGGSKDFARVTGAALLGIAVQLGLDEDDALGVLSDIRRQIIEVWDAGEELGFRKVERDRIAEHLRRVPFASERHDNS